MIVWKQTIKHLFWDFSHQDAAFVTNSCYPCFLINSTVCRPFLLTRLFKRAKRTGLWFTFSLFCVCCLWFNCFNSTERLIKEAVLPASAAHSRIRYINWVVVWAPLTGMLDSVVQSVWSRFCCFAWTNALIKCASKCDEATRWSACACHLPCNCNDQNDYYSNTLLCMQTKYCSPLVGFKSAGD